MKNQSLSSVFLLLLAVSVAALAARDQPVTPTPGPTPVVPEPEPVEVTQVTYVFPKRTAVPTGVQAALIELNQGGEGILATSVDFGVRNDEGQIPKQYVIAFGSITEADLPVLVVQDENTVVKKVRPPPNGELTKEQVLEAAK